MARQSMAVDRSRLEQLLREVKHKLALAGQDSSQLRKELALRPRQEELAGLKRQLSVLQKVRLDKLIDALMDMQIDGLIVQRWK